MTRPTHETTAGSTRDTTPSREPLREIVIALNGLPASFHGDPADRLIAATARAHRIPLATYDRVIRKSRVAIIWKAR